MDAAFTVLLHVVSRLTELTSSWQPQVMADRSKLSVHQVTAVNHLGTVLCCQTGFVTCNDFFMTNLIGTILVEVQEMIHDFVTKAFDSLIKVTDMFMTSAK